MSTLPQGRIKDAPEDFIVEEIPAYAASGAGEHLFVTFTKRNLTTDDAVHALARAVGVQFRDVGIAGMKDKVAVTTQTVSLPIPPGTTDLEARVEGLALPGITILSAKRHGNKLRTGHLEGNRFRLVVRGIEEARVDEVATRLEQAGREGIPNAFGSQRFGRDQDNAARAMRWLTGKERGPRDPRQKRFLWSALQSDLFNAVLAERVADGTWTTPLLGDVLKKDDTGGLFDCSDEMVDRARAERGEVSPTGPMFGVKMRTPSGRPGELERKVFEERLGTSFDLAATKPFGEGTRRTLRLRIEAMTVERRSVERLLNHPDDKADVGEEQRAVLMVSFVLPKGAYATSVLGTALALQPLEPPNKPTPLAGTEEAHEASHDEASHEAAMETEGL